MCNMSSKCLTQKQIGYYVKCSESEVINLKILIYTDLHCSYNSSILPLYVDEGEENAKFTVRLRRIIQTGKWLSELAKENNVDCIVNGGDTFDSTMVKAEELEAISKFFEYFKGLGVPHYVAVGNHEKVNDNFNASEILSGYDNVIVVDKPTKVNDELSILPYMDTSDIDESLLKTIANKVLVSHIDIKESYIREGVKLETGVRSEELAEHFEFVANGHIHVPNELRTSKNSVWNIGTVFSHSFSDDQGYIPSAVIFDTNTMRQTRYKNPNAILFRRIEGFDTSLEFEDLLDSYEDSFDYAFIVKYSDYENKEYYQHILSSRKNVLAFKLLNVYSEDNTEDIEQVQDFTDLDVKQKFIEFLDTVDCKYEKQRYLSVLEGVD